MPFAPDGSDRREYRGPGAPAKPFCRELPVMAQSLEDWAQCRGFVRSRGINPHVATINAWYPSRAAGDDHLRVVIPGTSQNPANQFWQARLIVRSDRPYDENGDPSAPPYSGMLPKRYQSPHAARGDAIIITYPDGDPAGSVLVEGPFDALAASELGFLGVALMGNTPSEEVLDHAVGWLRDVQPAVLVTDEDAVAQGASLARRLLAQHGLKSLLVLSPYPYKDLAEMPERERRRMIRDGGIKI